MIYPERPLIILLSIPAVASLFLLFRDDWLIPVTAFDIVLAAVALFTVVRTRMLVRSQDFRFTREYPALWSLGQSETVTLHVEYRGKVPVNLLLREHIPVGLSATPDALQFSLLPNKRISLTYKIQAQQRGTFRFDRIDALATRPGGFLTRALRWSLEHTVRVYPDVKQIGRYGLLAKKDKLSVMGVRRSRKLGADNEFERLREYIDGDDPRHIDWKATQRRQKLTVRGYQVNQSQRIMFLVDCGRMMVGVGNDGQTALDHAWNAMLLLAHVALKQGDHVGLIAYSDRIRAFVPMCGGAKHTTVLVHAVHNIFPEYVESRHDAAFLELDRRTRKRCLVVVITNVFDQVSADQIVLHLIRLVGRHLPLGVFLRDEDIFALADAGLANPKGLALYQGAAAAALLSWREQRLTELKSRGALVLDASPHELTAPLVNQYLQIKARHLL